jgi:hypothetical protein
LDLARGDIATLTAERLVFFMRPAKNMRHLKGKTVPIAMGRAAALSTRTPRSCVCCA